MATFDQVFADLQAKMSAAIAVIAQHPDIAAQVRDAIDSAHVDAEIAATVAADEARANAINNVMVDVRSALAAAAPRPTDPAPEPEPDTPPE